MEKKGLGAAGTAMLYPFVPRNSGTCMMMSLVWVQLPGKTTQTFTQFEKLYSLWPLLLPFAI